MEGNDLPEGYSIDRVSEGYHVSFDMYGYRRTAEENGKAKCFRKPEKAAEYARMHAVKRVATAGRSTHWIRCPFCEHSVYTGDPSKYWCEQCLTMFYIKGDKVWFDKTKESFANRAAKIAKGDIVG